MQTFNSKAEALRNRPTLREAPFPVGTRVKYIGTLQIWTTNNISRERKRERKLVLAPGIVVTISRVSPPRPDLLMVNYCEEDGDYYWGNEDGYSVFGEKPFGRIIWPEDAHKWERVE